MECPDCGGTGFIMDCCDDICVGSGECIHGDGEVVCETCDGEGEVIGDYDGDYIGDTAEREHYETVRAGEADRG